MSINTAIPVSQLACSTGTLVLEGEVPAGHLRVTYHEFSLGDDSVLMVHGHVNGVPLYRAKLEREGALFVVARDGDHETKLLFTETEDPDVYTLVVIQDMGTPELFRISKSKLIGALATRDMAQALVSGDASRLDLVGKRPAPKLTPMELYDAFGDSLEFKRFMRGRVSMARLLYETDTASARAKNIPGICIALFFCPACALVGIACALLS